MAQQAASLSSVDAQALIEIRELAAVMTTGRRSCFEARDLATVQLASVRKSLAELRGLEKELRRFVV